ncbi:MAG: corrinoid protein [Nitrososphaerota archaeon]|nr:corrinoid protein [Candidatus Bathyarchaeota archaeon]MDW8022929.1 corrinoid protein [Nitrososphaerota archaeon]
MGLLDDLVDAFANLDEEKTISLVKESLEKYDPAEIFEACRKATDIIGEKFEKGEYFLSELVMAGYIFNKTMELVLPKFQKEGAKPIGTIVLGTVEGDIHDIGKNIFKAFAEAAGFKVIDIGVDMPPEKFVEAVKEHKPDIVGLSGLLTLAIDAMRRTIEALKAAGLRDKVKVIIGGGRVDENARQYTGADAWADSATKGVKLCKELIGIQ